MRRTRKVRLLQGLALTVLLALPAAGAAGPLSAFVGRVITSATPLAPSGEEAEFVTYLRDRNQTTIRNSVEGPWVIYLIAFFSSPIGATDCHVALYEIGTGKPRFVDAIGQQVTPTQTTLSTRVDLSLDQFKPGSYELRVTRLIDGREKIYARTQLKLTK